MGTAQSTSIYLIGGSSVKELTAEEIPLWMDKRFAENPFMHAAKIKVEEVKYGFARLSMEADPLTHGNRYGAIHGGALFTLADTALGAVCYTIGSMVVTMSASTNFIKNTMRKEKVMAYAKLVHKGRSSVICQVEIFNEAKELMVEVMGTMFVVGHFDEIPEKW